MLHHYFRTILRNMRSLDAFINIIGLSIGFAFFITIFIWIHYERSYDNFHQDAASVFRITKEMYATDSLATPVAVTPGPLAEYLQSTQSAVEKVTRTTLIEFCIRTDINCLYKKGIAVDSSFLEVFTFPLLKGSASQFGSEANQIIITERLAKIFFGEADPIGKTFIIGPFNLLIVAVMKDPPAHTHFYEFEYLIPMDFMSNNGLITADNWDYSSLHTYVKLNKDSDPAEFEKTIAKTLIEKQTDSNSILKLQALQQIHLHSLDLGNDVPGRGNIVPALLLARQQAVESLKGQAKAGVGALSIRRILVVTQFSLAIGLVSATFIIQDQLSYINNRELGFDKENVISFTALRKFQAQFESLRSELKALEEVVAVTWHSFPITFIDQSTGDVEWPGKAENDHTTFHRLVVDQEFIKVYDLTLKSGRGFNEVFDNDTSSIIINERAAILMNIVEAAQQEIVVNDRKYRLIGIVNDFHFKSVHKTIEPLIMYTYPSAINNVSVKVTDDSQAVVAAVEAVFKKYAPERPFDYHFVDEDVANLYKTEQRTDVVFSYLGGFSLFISCLGLLGIVRFMTEQRAKEIAVRKVLGASTVSITGILTAEYGKILLIAFLISSTVVYWFMQDWLLAFAYRTDISLNTFLISFCFAILTAILTVGFVILKSVSTNPVVSLRSE
ncbi:MAG: ABC transporter permease [Cytophagia bacterium]|nr:ABC transporter permease [Cytophagia bacterium]